MEIGPFKGFFSSLSQICQLNFEIWNGEGFVFYSGTEREKMPGLEEIKAFSSQVVRGESFHTRFSEGRYAIFGVPIRNGDGVVGSLIAHGADDETRYESGKAFSIRSQEKEMELFLTYLAGLIEDKWTSQKETEELAEELSQSFSDLYLYARMATQIKSLTYSNNMLNGLIEDLLDTMRVDLTFAELPKRSEYNVLAHRPEVVDKLEDKRFFIRRLLGAMPDTMMSPEEHYFIINDSTGIPEYRHLHPEPYRFLAVKLQHNQEPYGWLGMVSFNLKEIFRRSELSLLTTVAEQIATVITNSELYRDLQSFVINMVNSMVHAIEAKDHYTRGHSERVNYYAMKIAERIEMDDEEMNTLHWASILHDIGKIGIPEAILNKPGRLTDEEYDVIKGHPEKGRDILKPIDQLKDALEGILHHHERFDGGGYPAGLKGHEIPLLGRIIAVADTFDAITTDRAYRKGKSTEEALTVMEEVTGTQLDPELFDVFKDLIYEDQLREGERSHVR